MYKEDEFGITRDPNPELSRLEGLFEQKLWSSTEARMILAGIDPESSGECRESMGVSYHYISLPGTKEKYGVDKLDSFNFHKNIEDSSEGNIGYLRGFIFGEESQTPAFWVQKAVEKQYHMPWYGLCCMEMLEFRDSQESRIVIHAVDGKAITRKFHPTKTRLQSHQLAQLQCRPC